MMFPPHLSVLMNHGTSFVIINDNARSPVESVTERKRKSQHARRQSCSTTSSVDRWGANASTSFPTKPWERRFACIAHPPPSQPKTSSAALPMRKPFREQSPTQELQLKFAQLCAEATAQLLAEAGGFDLDDEMMQSAASFDTSSSLPSRQPFCRQSELPHEDLQQSFAQLQQLESGDFDFDLDDDLSIEFSSASEQEQQTSKSVPRNQRSSDLTYMTGMTSAVVRSVRTTR